MRNVVFIIWVCLILGGFLNAQNSIFTHPKDTLIVIEGLDELLGDHISPRSVRAYNLYQMATQEGLKKNILQSMNFLVDLSLDSLMAGDANLKSLYHYRLQTNYSELKLNQLRAIHLDSAIHYASYTNNPILQSRLVMNQGILFMSQETPKPDSALYYMFKSLDMLKDIHEQNKSGNTENALMFNIGEIYEGEEKYEDALKYFKKLYLHSIRNQYHTTQYNALYHIGKCNYLSGKIKTGKKIITQALRDAKYHQDGHIVAEIHKNLAEIYTKEGKLELALKHEKEYSTYLDSIYIKKLAIAPAYVLQRKDMYFNKMQEAKAQSDFQETQRLLHLKNLQLKYLVVFSLVCVLGFYVFFKFKSRLQEQKQTIDSHKLTIDKNKVQIQ